MPCHDRLLLSVFVSEPYTTFKLKCFYCDQDDYGKQWEALMNDEECQNNLFDNCFTNRTLPGRHETHVLTLIRRCDVKYCVCADVNGWCKNSRCNFANIRCCLDFGMESVFCRV